LELIQNDWPSADLANCGAALIFLLIADIFYKKKIRIFRRRRKSSKTQPKNNPETIAEKNKDEF